MFVKSNTTRLCTIKELDAVENVLKLIIPGQVKKSLRQKKYCRLSYLLALIMNFGYVHTFLILSRVGLYFGMTDKSWLISLFRATVSLYCWYAITLRWKTYSKCIHRLKTLSHLKSSNTMHKIFTASVVVVAVIFPLVFASFNTYVNLSSQDEINTEFWLFGYGMYNSIQRKILLCIIFSTYYWVQFAFPCIVSFVYCTLAWDISRVATHLDVPQGVLDCKEIVQCLDERRKLTDFIDRFESIFTVVAFWLIVYNFVSLFSAFLMWLGVAQMTSLAATVEATIILTSSSSAFFGTVLCASRVPESLLELRRRLRRHHQNCLVENGPLVGNRLKKMLLLKSIIKEKESYFTAWGFVNIDKPIVINTLGALITYGILIEELNPKNLS